MPLEYNLKVVKLLFPLLIKSDTFYVCYGLCAHKIVPGAGPASTVDWFLKVSTDPTAWEQHSPTEAEH